MPAISTTPSVPVSINQLILLAYKRAGLVPVEARISGANMVPKLEHGRQLLDILMDNLAVEGFAARTVSFYDLPIVAGESQYTLPDSILDVHDDAMFISSDNPDTKHTTSELVCKQIDLTAWQSLTNKGMQSPRPQLYAAFRHGATVQLKFWPVPSEAGTIRLTTARLLGGNATGTNTPDLQRYWTEALVWLLAHKIAVDSSLPTERCNYLLTMGEAEKRKCVAYSFQHTDTVAVLNYPTQWSC